MGLMLECAPPHSLNPHQPRPVVDIQFTPEQVERLAKIGSIDGKQPEKVVQDIVDRALTDDARFREAVQRGIASADRGEFIEEEETDARVARMFSR